MRWVEVSLFAAGWIGACALLAAYVLASLGRLGGRDLRFQMLNLFGSAGLAANAGYHEAWPSAVLNVVWLAIGVGAVARIWRRASASGRSPPPRTMNR